MSQTTTKSALVTGASSGIGLAMVNALIEDQYQVTGIARDFSNTALGAMTSVTIDLSEVDDLPKRLSDIETLNRAVDVLVLNAGYGRFGGIEQFSHSQIQHLVNTNLVSNLFLIKHFLPMMKKRGGGDIFIVGSESALDGAKAGAVYCATKFALRGLAQSLRADCSTANIRVMLLNPGPVNSDFFADLNFEPQDGDEFAIEPSIVAEAMLHALQQPRNTVTEEINLQPIKRSFQKKS